MIVEPYWRCGFVIYDHSLHETREDDSARKKLKENERSRPYQP